MKRIVTAIALTLASCASAPVAAQECPSIESTESVLTGQYGEQVTIAAVTEGGTAIMFWINPETDTWTITETVGSCTFVRAAGDGVSIIPMGEPV